MDQLKVRLNTLYEELKLKQNEMQIINKQIKETRTQLQIQCQHLHVVKLHDYDGHRSIYTTICLYCDKQL
jgi:hypothetical protein